jgi:hypothetical protein
MKLINGGITMRKMKAAKQIAKEQANCKKKREEKREVKTGMSNQNIKIVQKAAQKHERLRWAKKLQELKNRGIMNEDTATYLRMIIEKMQDNANFCKEM